jgi:hypothetical protein
MKMPCQRCGSSAPLLRIARGQDGAAGWVGTGFPICRSCLVALISHTDAVVDTTIGVILRAIQGARTRRGQDARKLRLAGTDASHRQEVREPVLLYSKEKIVPLGEVVADEAEE